MSSSSYFVVRAGSTAVTNEAIFSGISHTALGILIRALSSRPGATLGYRDFMTDGVGERLVRRSLSELEAAGLRHRILTRAGAGALRTVVIYCDVPMDATDVITQIDGLHLIKVQSKRDLEMGRYSPRSHRADTVSARSDQGKQKVAENSDKKKKPRSHRADTSSARSEQVKDPVSPVRTVPTLPEHGEPEHGRPEHGKSRQVPYGNSIPSGELKPTLPPPTPHGGAGADDGRAASPQDGAPDGAGGESPRADSGHASGEGRSDGPVRKKRPESSVAALKVAEVTQGRDSRKRPPVATPGDDLRHSGSAEDRDLLERALPSAMRAIPPRDIAKVARAVRQRLDAGWTVEQVRAGLGARDLPDHVRHLTALVMARFRDDLPLGAAPLSGAAPVAATARSGPWRVALACGRVVEASDLDLGALAIAHNAAKAEGDPRAMGGRFAFAEAVGVEQFLVDPVGRPVGRRGA